MFEKIKQIFKRGTAALETKAQQEKVAEKTVVAPEMPKVEEKQKPSTMDLDEKILRCFVLYSEYIEYSTKGAAIYVYVKPGYTGFSSNINFVKEVYSLNNIKLNKHVSHLDNKETEVLYISLRSYMEDLNDTQRQFFKRTAPKVEDLSDYRFRDDSSIFDRAHDIDVKIGIESGQIDPKVWRDPIRLPYNTNKTR